MSESKKGDPKDCKYIYDWKDFTNENIRKAVLDFKGADFRNYKCFPKPCLKKFNSDLIIVSEFDIQCLFQNYFDNLNDFFFALGLNVGIRRNRKKIKKDVNIKKNKKDSTQKINDIKIVLPKENLKKKKNDPDFVLVENPRDINDNYQNVIAIEVKNPWQCLDNFKKDLVGIYNSYVGFKYEKKRTKQNIEFFETDGNLTKYRYMLSAVNQTIGYMKDLKFDIKYSVLTNLNYHWFCKFQNDEIYISHAFKNDKNECSFNECIFYLYLLHSKIASENINEDPAKPVRYFTDLSNQSIESDGELGQPKAKKTKRDLKMPTSSKYINDLDE